MKGLQSAIGRIRSISPRCRQAMEGIIGKTVQLTRDEAQGMAPVRTGALRASIRSRASGLEGAVETGCPYGAAVELGTLCTPARPFLLPAARQSKYHENAKNALKEMLL